MVSRTATAAGLSRRLSDPEGAGGRGLFDEVTAKPAAAVVHGERQGAGNRTLVHPSPTHPEHHGGGVGGEPDVLVIGRSLPLRRSPGRPGTSPRSPSAPFSPELRCEPMDRWQVDRRSGTLTHSGTETTLGDIQLHGRYVPTRQLGGTHPRHPLLVLVGVTDCHDTRSNHHFVRSFLKRT